MKPSKYQQAIFNWIKNGSGNVIIQAVAGSGKTTTIVEASKLIPTNKTCIFVAFNKAIADELRSRLPPNIRASTLHSLGLSMFEGNTNIKPEIKGDKLDGVIGMVLEDEEIRKGSTLFSVYFMLLKKLIPLIKATNSDISMESLIDITTRYDIEADIDDRLLGLIIKVLRKCSKTIDIIDYDDMIWIPVMNDFKTKKYDWVLVDEVQDLNKIQFELIKMVCGKNTRVIAVGDEKQSIYAFRGADTESMKNFKEYFKAEELPLSICYRCPKKVIELAKELVPEIECSEEAKLGIVDDISFDRTIILAEDKNLILCRTNAPLVKIAFGLIRNGKKAIIRGRDIGKNLITMVNKYKVVNLNDLLEKITTFQKLQQDKIDLIDKGLYEKRKKGTLMTQIDSCETILTIGETCETVEELKNKIETIFSDDKNGIVCSSVHKAKGLEAETVFILNYTKMPHPMAKTEEELRQEDNIKYVALTRSKNSLYFIEGEW